MPIVKVKKAENELERPFFDCDSFSEYLKKRAELLKADFNFFQNPLFVAKFFF